MESVRLENALGDHVHVDLNTGNLWFADGREATLRPRATQVLEELVREPGALVSRQEFLDAIWPGEMVVDGVLRNAILELRKAFSSLDTKAIVSVPRKGYRLTLAVAKRRIAPHTTTMRRWSRAHFALLIVPILALAASVGEFKEVPDCSVRLIHTVDPASPLRIESSPSIDIDTQDFSISAWVQANGDRGTLLDKRVLTPRIQGIAVGIYDGRLLLQLASDRGWRNFLAPFYKIRVDGAWTHLAIAVDRDETWGGTFYVNGRAVGKFDPTSYAGSLSNGADLLIGNSYDFPDPFPGRIDHLQIIDTTLDSSDVADLYHALDGNRACYPG